MNRPALLEWTLQPGTGKAFEVRAGQILRIAQIDGGQCIDFNCFNLHDYKEFMHCGRTRTVHGFHPSKGTFLWSAPPRERAMMFILEDTFGRNDVLFPRCSSYIYESAYGYDAHTNCQDIQAEAQREYGLTPDDVHDSFNFFMCTEVTGPHRATMTRQNSQARRLCRSSRPDRRAGDTKYLRVRRHADEQLLAEADEGEHIRGNCQPRSTACRRCRYCKASARQRTFRNPNIKADRELRKDAQYVPAFTNVPILVEDLNVALSAEEVALLEETKLELYGDDDSAALRDIFFTWWEERFLAASSGAPAIGGSSKAQR